MIVRHHNEGFSIVLQRHHARIAALLLTKLSWLEGDPNMPDLCMATAEHDNDYNEFHREALLTDMGAPRDFKMEKFHKAQCEQLFEDAFAKSLLQACLTVHHMNFVHGDENKESRAYCTALLTRQKKWIKQLGLTQADIKKYYAILQWCDALSLILCQQLVPPEGRELEISPGPDDQRYFIREDAQNTFSIHPWPFILPTFTIDIESRLLNKLSFDSDHELQAALYDCDVVVETYTFRAAKQS